MRGVWANLHSRTQRQCDVLQRKFWYHPICTDIVSAHKLRFIRCKMTWLAHSIASDYIDLAIFGESLIAIPGLSCGWYSAVTVIIIYDWLLTLSDEVRLVWNGKMTGAKVFFLANRYIYIVSHTIQIVCDQVVGASNSVGRCLQVHGCCMNSRFLSTEVRRNCYNHPKCYLNNLHYIHSCLRIVAVNNVFGILYSIIFIGMS